MPSRRPDTDKERHLNNLRKCLFLFKEEKRAPWMVVILFAMFVTVVEAVGALLIFVLLGAIAAPDGPIELPIVGDVRELQGDMSSETLIVVLASGVAIFFIVRGLLMVAEIYAQDRIAYNAGARLASRLFETYLRMPYLFHLRRNSAELIRNAYESVRALTGEVIRPTVRLISSSALAVGMLAVLFFAAPLATLAALLTLGPFVFLLVRIVQPRLKALGRERQDVSRASLKVLQQSLHGIREIKVFGRSKFFHREFSTRQFQAARVGYINRVYQELPSVLLETALVVFIAGFFVVSTMLQEGSPQEGIAVLGLFAYAALRLQPSIQKITQCVNSIRFAGAAIDNVYDDLRLDDAEGQVRAADIGRSGARAGHGAGVPRIALETVEFRYAEGATPALARIDISIEPGESIGIVGPTGGGKSTLLDVMVGLLRPTSGRVLIDGVDLVDCTQQWQARLGMVSQTVFLLDDTLRRNVALGLPDGAIDERRVGESVELAQLRNFIDELPEGLDTKVGERGVRLSGGQRQRLAIARALYRDPDVLIFDEGTSALDNVTEAEFMSALARLRGARTIITVAHRLTTVRNTDRIFVLEHGEIVDTGTYERLLSSNANFKVAVDSPAPEVETGSVR